MTGPDPHDLRQAFGRFMTGVTVVTTCDASGRPLGFTANSFTSVSLHPPLLLVCPGRFLSCFDAFATCTDFAVNILAEGQETVSNTFASFKGDRFAQVAHRRDRNGNPLIDGAIAQFSCATHQVVEAGDHCLLIGRVTTFDQHEGAGLGYADGRYFSLGLERDMLETTDRQVICGAIIETAGHALLERTPQGYRPPQIARKDRTQLRPDLKTELSRRGVSAELGAVYSVFDDATAHSAYILARAERPLSTQLEAVPLERLATLAYTTEPIADMMTRFAVESRTRDFGLYLGDAQHGETHTHTERS